MDGPLRVMGVREEPFFPNLELCSIMVMLHKTTQPKGWTVLVQRCTIPEYTYLLIIFRTDTIDFFKKTVDGKYYKGAFMRRKPVNFKKSADSFKKRAKLVHKKNTPSYRNARGGIRL